MSTVAPPGQLMTTEQLFALPDDDMERELFRGELRERPVTRRGHQHGQAVAQVAVHLVFWLKARPKPRGAIVGGEGGFRLRRDPDSSVGIDVGYASAESVAATPASVAYYDGPPGLAVEVLSRSDRQGDVDDKIELYLETGVAVVWIINPRFQTVTVYRPEAQPVVFNARQELSTEPDPAGISRIGR